VHGNFREIGISWRNIEQIVNEYERKSRRTLRQANSDKDKSCLVFKCIMGYTELGSKNDNLVHRYSAEWLTKCEKTNSQYRLSWGIPTV